MNFKQFLTRSAGIWVGTYTHLSPDGTLRECFKSHWEGGFEADGRWHERITYIKAGKSGGEERITRDFYAVMEGDRVVMADELLVGEAVMADEKTVVFPHYWKSEPGVKMVETIRLEEQQRTRLWMKHVEEKLEQITVIVEKRPPA